MKTGSFRELSNELDRCEDGKRELDEVLNVLKRHRIVVKAIEARVAFFVRRIQELKNAIVRCQKECKPHNWICGMQCASDEVVCTKCGSKRRK